MTTLFGRPLWNNPPKLISFELDGGDSSRQIFDIYSFSHATHGILFFFIFQYFKIRPILGLFLAIILEFLWEIFENTDYIIKKYRKTYEKYEGDSIANIIGDIIFTIMGYIFALNYSKIAIIYLILSEIVLIPYKANFLHLSIGSLINY